MSAAREQSSVGPVEASAYDYDEASRRYDQHRRVGGPFIGPLVDLAKTAQAKTVLEVGAGTGNVTESFLNAYPSRLFALDRSMGMLQQGRAKNLPVQWLQADAQQLPLARGSVHFIFGVLVLHHIPDLDALFQECFRVLRSGPAAFVTASHDFIERHPMNRYFPSFAKVDKARFPARSAIYQAMDRAGFTRLAATDAKAAPEPIDKRYAERVANRFISTYDLLPEQEFQEGVERLRNDVNEFGRLDVDMVWESLVVSGWKPEQ